jgi:hypothetical protein
VLFVAEAQRNDNSSSRYLRSRIFLGEFKSDLQVSFERKMHIGYLQRN